MTEIGGESNRAIQLGCEANVRISKHHMEVTVKIERVLTSMVATLMVLNMMILTAATIPVHTKKPHRIEAQAPQPVSHEAGFFGCLWSCLKCVGTVGTNGKSCRKCAHCLGDDTPEEPASNT